MGVPAGQDLGNIPAGQDMGLPAGQDLGNLPAGQDMGVPAGQDLGDQIIDQEVLAPLPEQELSELPTLSSFINIPKLKSMQASYRYRS